MTGELVDVCLILVALSAIALWRKKYPPGKF